MENQWKSVFYKKKTCAGHVQAITQYRGMYSYLPWVINQSESEILNSHGKKYF
jgi:hypothetical protein